MFIAYVNETNNGCDYTIACGKVLWELCARTREDAEMEIKRKVLGTFYPQNANWEGGYDLVSVTLFEVCHKAEIPLREWYAKADQMRENAMGNQKESKERQEYERLKRKYDSS